MDVPLEHFFLFCKIFQFAHGDALKRRYDERRTHPTLYDIADGFFLKGMYLLLKG